MYQNQMPNPIIQMFGNVQNFQNKLNMFQQQLAQSGINSQAQVQNLLNSGRMTQNQFNYFRSLANTIMGTNF